MCGNASWKFIRESCWKIQKVLPYNRSINKQNGLTIYYCTSYLKLNLKTICKSNIPQNDCSLFYLCNCLCKGSNFPKPAGRLKKVVKGRAGKEKSWMALGWSDLITAEANKQQSSNNVSILKFGFSPSMKSQWKLMRVIIFTPFTT